MFILHSRERSTTWKGQQRMKNEEVKNIETTGVDVNYEFLPLLTWQKRSAVRTKRISWLFLNKWNRNRTESIVCDIFVDGCSRPQQMVNCWVWVGCLDFFGIPLSKNPRFIFGELKNPPNHQWIIRWSRPQLETRSYRSWRSSKCMNYKLLRISATSWGRERRSWKTNWSLVGN